MDSRHSSNRSVSITALIVLFILFIISGALLAFLLRDIDWSLIKYINPIDLFFIFALTVLGTIVYVALIMVLVRGSGYRVSFKMAYLVLTASLTANYVTPVKIGIPLRIYLYNQIMGIPVDVGTALITVETLIGILLPALVASVGISFVFPVVGPAPVIVMIIALLTFLILFLRFSTEQIIIVAEKLPFARLSVRIFQFAGRVQIALKLISPSTIFLIIVLDILILFIQAARLWLTLNIFITAPSVILLLFVLTISVTIGNLSMIPMGLGVRDASFSFLLTRLNVSSEIALSASVVQRLFSPGWPLLLGIISTNILGVGKLIQRKEESLS